MRRGRVTAYGLWQFRDYTWERGIPMVLIFVLLTYVTLAPMFLMVQRDLDMLPATLVTRYGGMEGARHVLTREANQAVLRNLLGVIVYVGALVAMNGIAATDRKRGFYRFLFAKPVSPARYYGQAFVVHWAAFVAIIAALAVVYGAFVTPILTLPLISAIALMFLLYAGIVFLLSALARSDWLVLVLVTVIASYLWDRFGKSEAMAARLLYLLPPLHRTAEIYTAAAKGEPIDRQLLAWFAGYGLACVVGGLVVLRHRRLAVV